MIAVAVTLAAAVGVSGVGLAGGPGEAARSCVGPGGQHSEARAVETRVLDDRVEATESLPRGAYRVSRCDLDGEFVHEQTVAPFTRPDGTTIMLPTSETTVLPSGHRMTVQGLRFDPVRDPASFEKFRAELEALSAGVSP